MRVIVTGAASGIGRAVCRLFAAEPPDRTPPRLLLVDRDAAALAAVADELRAGCDAVETAVADLADPAAPSSIVAQAADRLGGLDALVSNAGAIHAMAIEQVSAAEFDRMMAINVRATLLLGQAALPLLKQSHGSLVATASISATNPTPSLGVYSASKAALVMLVEQMALEWGPFGIRCNAVSPGPTHTGMTAASYDDPARRDRRAQDIPLRRVGEPEDLARAILFLIGPAAAFISGINLVVDGGLSRTVMVSSSSAAHTVTG
ncbi:MAG: SDR family NAD(P)-dependent oxidoreductase [Janthinobacterium lividum]